MSEKNKVFNVKLYAIFAFVFVALFLVLVTVFTFKAKYAAFHPEELARAYVSSIVSTGDGYNAYKNTLVSKNMKYGDFIREQFINPVIDRDIQENGKSYSDDSFKGEKTLDDDGTLSGKLIAEMFPVYKELIELYGWDNYSAIFTEYIEKLIRVREEIFGDKFFNDEVFFSAFEANVSAYGKYLTGTDEVYDENSGVKLSDKTEGVYQKLYGEDYKIICEASEPEYGYSDGWLMNAQTDILSAYSVEADDISDVASVLVSVRLDSGEELTSCKVTLVKIGMTWYVDNTITNTSSLYVFNFAE